MTGRPVPRVNAEIAAARSAEIRTLPDGVAGIDVDALITIADRSDVDDRRRRLTDYIWKGAGLPQARPEPHRDIVPADLDPLSAARIERIDHQVGPAVSATSYLVHPRRSRGPSDANKYRLALYLSGHGNPRAPKYHRPQLAAMQLLLDHGYRVAAVDMPFLGWNTQPPGPDGAADPRSLHENLADEENETFSAVSYFLDPPIQVINSLAATRDLDEVTVIGFSGGAWTTTLLAAIDPRVTRSFPVAGSCPFYLRPFPRQKPNHGDWEQRRDSLPGLYAVAGYLDLYLLGGAGAGRRQVQILNRFDPVCFSGVGHRSYARPVADRTALLGGSFDVVDDPTHGEHQVSPYALSVIDWELDQDPQEAAR